MSNFEVLQLLRAQRSSTDAKLKQLNERKQAHKSAGVGDSLDFTEKDRIKPENLQTVTFEVSLAFSNALRLLLEMLTRLGDS